MMALHCGLELDFSLGGIFGLSGYLLPYTNVKNNGTPITMFHGLKDEKILWQNVEPSIANLKQRENFSITTFKDLDHSISLEEYKRIKKLIEGS